MLKALELNGFKSFADRTRFEFPAGITAVVGPNGSGKSNIVDAIKWVLGTQSVKALRGKEMTDVIFSGAQGRSQTNAAEVTLIFDNTEGTLDVDAGEVQISRRVYRSGEGEYLINRQPCRLRDIRDVFAGTGVATGAYSIIEQGKVDALLQSSPRERRLMFEEAAGVSRFKLKRQEADRRLQRVDQNLLRLSDIVEELDSRLRSVRSQAGRARKYKDQADRLKYLRIQVALSEWRSQTAKLQHFQRQADQQRQSTEQLSDLLSGSDQKLNLLEQSIDQLLQQTHDIVNRVTVAREQIAQSESTRRSQLARHDELRQESQRMQCQLLTMTSRAGNAQQLVAETVDELHSAERQYDTSHSQVEQLQTQLDRVATELSQCRSEADALRHQQNEAIREATQLEKQIHVLDSEHTAALAASVRFRSELEHAEQALTEVTEQFATAEQALLRLEDEVYQSQQRLDEVEEKLRADRISLSQAQKQLADLRGRLTGAKERAVVLEELERRLDGLSAGTKEVLRLAHDEPQGPFGSVRGVVADLLNVDADTASLVEIALGEKANHLLVEHTHPAMFTLASDEWPGRTSFLRMDVPLPASAVDRIDLSAEPGVMGRADQFVETAAELAALPRRLLGRTWFVESLETALRLASGIGRGLNFVTVVGEVVGADGTLVVGPRQSTTGLLSRRSELRALVDEIRDMESRIELQNAVCISLEESILVEEDEQSESSKQHQKLSKQLSAVQLQVASLRERLDQANRRQASASTDFLATESKHTTAAHDLDRDRKKLSERQAGLGKLADLLKTRSEQACKLEQQVAQLQRSVTDYRVALARSEQRRDGLRRQMDQLHRDREEHDRALFETRERVAQCHEQGRQLEQSVLDLSSELAELYRLKEHLASQSQGLAQRQEALRHQKVRLSKNCDQLRQRLLNCQGILQQTEIRVQQLKQQRDDAAARLADDYGVDLAVLATTDAPCELQDFEAAESEIQTLRAQLQNIGPVNLEALSELEAIEQRHSALSEQYQDLRNAKARLEQLVTKINVESRELFVKALDVIRGHFQELYSNLFGGGEADIIIDESDGGDVLECGIEIIARPPGKQPRSISLLSGGERTLTCVALLLAIFRSRPSPFCVLDEVDAALDEANIDRFAEVLKQFMTSTQFLVVTHSKRTMACADTLYGITMQESGVSKRVSVRFEDVSAEGHIRADAGETKAA
ncbi:MAG: chromosome segregation protein SMC [Planctomycetales bacterium]|nr:chromosome segregation protein SMC [Planctomycetales bacterium]